MESLIGAGFHKIGVDSRYTYFKGLKKEHTGLTTMSQSRFKSDNETLPAYPETFLVEGFLYEKRLAISPHIC